MLYKMTDFKKIHTVFKKEYKKEKVPLEVFGKNKYKTLISTILSARTNDDTTIKASKRLFRAAPNIESLKNLKVKQIEKLIYPIGFYKTKAKYIKKTAQEISKKYNGQVPGKREELIKLPGVGRKTANLVLNRAFQKPAIAVDTHVHKISNILGLVQTKTPEQTEKELNSTIPEKYWADINRYFVSIGRQYTTKKRLMEFFEKNKLI